MWQVDPKTDLDEVDILQNKNMHLQKLYCFVVAWKKTTQSKEYGR